MNLLLKLMMIIFGFVSSLDAMESAGPAKINNNALAEIYDHFLSVFNARQSFIRSVESELSLINEKDIFISFVREIVESNDDKDNLDSRNFPLLKMDIFARLKNLLSDQEQFHERITREFLHRDGIITDYKNAFSERSSPTLLKKIEDLVLVDIYLSLLNGLEASVEFNRQSKLKELRNHLHERCQAYNRNRRPKKAVLFCLNEGFNPAHLYEETMNIIVAQINENLALVLKSYKEIKKARENFLIQERHNLKIEMENLLTNIEDQNVYKQFPSLSDFTQNFLLQKEKSERKNNPTLELAEKLFELAEARNVCDALANEIKILQQRKQQARQHALFDVSMTTIDETHSPAKLSPREKIFEACEEKKAETAVFLHVASSETEMVFDYQIVDQKNNSDENHDQQKALHSENNDLQRSKQKADTDRKLRILARLKINSTQKPAEDKPVKSLRKLRTHDLVQALPKHLAALLNELVNTTDHHKKYTFKDLLSLVDGFHGKSVVGSGSSHFTFAIDGVGSIHLVYAHGKKKDSVKLSGGYVRAFIRQLVALDFIEQN